MIGDIVVIVGECILFVAAHIENFAAHSRCLVNCQLESPGDHIYGNQIAAAVAPEKGHIQMGIVHRPVGFQIVGLFTHSKVLFIAESEIRGDHRLDCGADLGVCNIVFLAPGSTLKSAGSAHETGTESAGVSSDALLFQHLDTGRRDDPPMDHQRLDKGLFTGKADDMVVYQIVVPSEFLFACLNVKTVGEFTKRVERHLQPVGVVDKFALPDIRHLAHVAVKVIVVEKTVQRRLESGALVDLFQTLEIEVVKGAFGAFLCKIGPEKAVVVNVAIETPE